MNHSDNDKIILGLNSVFVYLEATPSSRCVCEGEEVLNTKHLILCDITSVEMGFINI